MDHRWTVVLGLVSLVVTMAAQGVFAADYDPESPAGIIDRYGNETVATLNNDTLTQGKNLEPLRNQLYDQIAPIINFPLMTRSALGPEARSINSDQLDRLVDVFQPLGVRLYSGRLMDYLVKPSNPWRIDKMVIKGQKKRGGGQYALVRSKAYVHRDGTERTLSMNFKMIRGEKRWQVYDLVFENVSLVENYRSQFTSVLTNNSIDHLIQQLEQKLEKIRAGDTPDTAVELTG